MKKIVWWVGLALVLMVATSGCGRLIVASEGEMPTPVVTLEGRAAVDSVEVLLLESFPVQVDLVVRGDLPDGCTDLGDYSVEREGAHFTVVLSTTRPEDAMCTEALVPFEVTIPLDVEGLEAGTYTVDVNGVEASFTLDVDNVLGQEPEAEPGVCDASAGEGEAAFSHSTEGYCLLYPAEFTVTEPEAGVVVIHGPDYSGGGLEPLSGFVNIQAGRPAEGGSLAEAVVMLFPPEDLPADVVIDKTDVSLGGVPAVEIAGVPAQRADRHVVAVQDDRIVHLVFSPMGEEYGEAASDMQRLYELVMRSFTFLPGRAVPSVPIADAVLSWRHTFRSECAQAILSLSSGAAGRCDEPLTAQRLGSSWITRNLPYLVATYAPFEAETPAGTVVFTGTGTLAAIPVEQQMIAEFARIADGILESGSEESRYGLAFVLHREGGLAGICENVEVYVSGEVFISSCGGETPERLAYGRLTALELERLYGLLDTYAFFEWADDTEVVYDGLAVDLVFFGRGDVAVEDAGRQVLLDLAGEVYARLIYGEIRPGGAPMWVVLPEGWTVGQTRETVLGTLTVVGVAPMDPQAENSSIYVADAEAVPLEHAVKRIFCGPSDCEPDVELEDVTIDGAPAKRSVPAGDVEIAWYFMSYGGKTITFTVFDPATHATRQDVVDAIRLVPVD